MKYFSSSLSLRLLSIFIVTAVLLFIILVAAFSSGLNGQWRRSIQPHLVQYVEYVQQDLGSPPIPDRANALSARLLVDIYIYEKNQFIYSTNGQTLEVDKLAFHSVTRRTTSSARKTNSERKLDAYISNHSNERKRILRIDQKGFSVYYDLQNLGTKQRHLSGFFSELLLALAGLVIVLAGSYMAIRHQLLPIRQIQKSVKRMSNAELEHRINRSGNSDLDVLSHSIDSMADRLQALLDAKRQLLMALSHELRSPVTRARITIELLGETIHKQRLLDDLQNMERIINDIMESERLQSNHTVLNKQAVDVHFILSDELNRLCPDATLTGPINPSGCLIEADEARLRIVFRNLLLNATQHGTLNSEEPKIDVSLVAESEFIEIVIRDHGLGIAPEQLKSVTDPFYRPDPSRSRDTGGFGMGLTLAKLITEAHAGTMKIESYPDIEPGTRITICLPRVSKQA
ncbi:MAG: signal transduction histidine kinase [Granulosicoccus sp.]|jgi:signal transduction histidine kinase